MLFYIGIFLLIATQQIPHVSITTKISQVMLCRENSHCFLHESYKSFAHSIQSAELFNVKASTTCQLLLYLTDLKCEFHIHLACCL